MIFTGWQNKENKYSDDIIDRIVVHEMGHAIVGFLSNDHARLSKIVLNLLSQKHQVIHCLKMLMKIQIFIQKMDYLHINGITCR